LDERIRATRREFKLRAKLERSARKIAALELARRLDELNHAHAEAKRVASLTVTRELFDNKIGTLEESQRKAEVAAGTLLGKLWLPLIAVAALVAGGIEWAFRVWGK
jgi:hypothetical protein